MNQEDLVSVIMPTYNAGKYLADSINSILNQSYKNLELLITDDASTDPTTVQLLQEFASKDNRVDILYLKENHGAGYARNQSIERAKGRYIAFCDSDDRWTTDKLEKQIAFMNKKKCALSCASYIIFDGETQNEIGFCTAPKKITYGMMKRDNKVGCLPSASARIGLCSCRLSENARFAMLIQTNLWPTIACEGTLFPAIRCR